MSKQIMTRFALGSQADLTTPTSAQEYPLGEIFDVYDTSTKVLNKYMYVKSHAALTAYVPYTIAISSTSAAEVTTQAALTLAAPGRIVCVPQVGFTSGYYGFVLVGGDGSVIMKAETYAAGDHLQLVTTRSDLVVDGTSGATTFSVNTCAVTKESDSDAVARTMYLFYRQAVVAGS